MAMTPRKAPAGTDEQAQQDRLPLSEQITYLPREGDPPSTRWHGHVFHANVPKTVTKAELIEAARNNRFFKVGSFDPAKDSTAALSEVPADDPKTSEQYRARVVAWLKRLDKISADPEQGPGGALEAMVKTWAKEQHMREACEVGSDDYSYIGSLFLPKMHQFSQAAGLNQQAVAELWARNGVFQLPF
jgi:hypothetical protein